MYFSHVPSTRGFTFDWNQVRLVLLQETVTLTHCDFEGHSGADSLCHQRTHSSCPLTPLKETVVLIHYASKRFGARESLYFFHHIILCAPSPLPGVSPILRVKQYYCRSDWRWSFVLSSKIVERVHCLRRSPPADRWCDVLGVEPTGSISSCFTLQIFRNVSHLWWLLFPPVYLLAHFPRLQ